MNRNRKHDTNRGAALYLIVVFISIAVSLLAIMYSSITASAINEINRSSELQDKLFLESAAEMYRAGYDLDEINILIQSMGGAAIEVEILDFEGESEEEEESEECEQIGVILRLENSKWELSFVMQDGFFSNYLFNLRSDIDEE